MMQRAAQRTSVDVGIGRIVLRGIDLQSAALERVRTEMVDGLREALSAERNAEWGSRSVSRLTATPPHLDRAPTDGKLAAHLTQVVLGALGRGGGRR